MSDRARLLELIREHSFRTGDFLLASGKRSDFYIDLRKTSLTAEGATLIGRLLLSELDAAGWSPAAVGGLTLGADPLTTATGMAAFAQGRPLAGFLVRKAPKDHGTGKRIERAGDLQNGAAVVVLDDTVTTGGSTLDAVRAAQSEGFQVLGALCVVDRGEGGAEALAEAGIPLRSLFALSDLRG